MPLLLGNDQRKRRKRMKSPEKRRSGSIGAVVLLAVAAAGYPAIAQAAAPSAPDDALRAGARAISAGRFAEAAADYAVVTRAMPNFAEAWLNLGLAQEQAGDLDKARAALEKAAALKPGLRGAHLFLGIVEYRQNRYREAENNLQRETRIDPGNANPWMWLGVCYLAEGRPESAIPPLDKAHSLDPRNPDILYHRGRAYMLVANASYAAMFSLNHDSVRVHQMLGEAYATGYRTSEAISEFETAVKMAPRQPGLHEELADQYWVAGQLDKAEEGYRAELQVDPYAVTSMYKLGSLLVLNRNPQEGISFLRSALRSDPSLSDAHYYLGTGLMGLDRNQEAVGEFQQAIAADPSNDRAMSSYYKLAMLYRKLHDKQDEQDAMSKFLRMKSQTAAKQNRYAAQIARARNSLPVDDPEKNLNSPEE